ncbi:MAG: ACT domain-containing protein [Pyrinomonadaceae bacterium]
MANEELIYLITRAVYNRLGAETPEHLVESLVTDIYKSIEPHTKGAQDNSAQSNSISEREDSADSSGSSERLVISVFGVDRPGIMAVVSQVLADAGCSIVDINQTVVRGKFAMVLIANMSQAMQSATALKERFRAEGARLGVRIYAQREDIFNAMHRV